MTQPILSFAQLPNEILTHISYFVQNPYSLSLSSKNLTCCVNENYNQKIKEIFKIMTGEFASQSNRKIVQNIHEMKLQGNLVPTRMFKILYFLLKDHLKPSDLDASLNDLKGDLTRKALAMAKRVKEIDDENLEKVWPRVQNELVVQNCPLAKTVSFNSADQIRRWLDRYGVFLIYVKTLDFSDLDITFLPEEIKLYATDLKKLIMFNTSRTMKISLEALYKLFPPKDDDIVHIIMT